VSTEVSTLKAYGILCAAVVAFCAVVFYQPHREVYLHSKTLNDCFSEYYAGASKFREKYQGDGSALAVCIDRLSRSRGETVQCFGDWCAKDHD